MVAHQTVGEGVGDWLDVVGVELEKVRIVALLYKDALAIVAAVVDVIVVAVFKWNRLRHSVLIRRPDRRFARPVRSMRTRCAPRPLGSILSLEWHNQVVAKSNTFKCLKPLESIFYSLSQLCAQVWS